MDTLELSVFQTAGNKICAAWTDGEKVFERLDKALTERQPVKLSFHGVEFLVPSFLNAAIGQLYGKFDEELIKTHIQFVDIDDDGVGMIDRVAYNAKMYYKDPKRFMRIVRREARGMD